MCYRGLDAVRPRGFCVVIVLRFFTSSPPRPEGFFLQGSLPKFPSLWVFVWVECCVFGFVFVWLTGSSAEHFIANDDGFEYFTSSSLASLPGLFWSYSRSALYAESMKEG